MRPAFKYANAMSSSPLPLARPYTPPESLDERPPSPIPDFLHMRPATNTSSSSDDIADAWATTMITSPIPRQARQQAHEQSHPHGNPYHPPPYDPASRPRPIHTESEPPYTPTKASSHDYAPTLPRYPYTPDSARTAKSYITPTLPPLPPMPWARDESHTSPVQSALFSCLNNLEHLIHTSEPDDHQMSFIVSRFEEVSSYLTAPEAQSKPSDEHLFDSEVGGTSNLADSGIADMGSTGSLKKKLQSREEKTLLSYVKEVDVFIDGVKKNTEGLKKRHEETKQLNSILLDVIADLRNDLHEHENPKVEQKPRVIRSREIKPPRWSFWFALGDALDSFSELFYEV